jgi:hypothetical protein
VDPIVISTTTTTGYSPLGLTAQRSAGDSADGDTGPRTVLTIRFGHTVLYLYESLHARGALVIDVEEADPQPAGLRLVIGGNDAFTTAAEAAASSPREPRTTGTTLQVAECDMPHLLAALNLADALAGWSIHGLLPAGSDRELGRLRRDALARIRAGASRG